jgi:hypothetical protein
VAVVVALVVVVAVARVVARAVVRAVARVAAAARARAWGGRGGEGEIIDASDTFMVIVFIVIRHSA